MLRKKIGRILRTLGIKSCYRGYGYAVECIALAVEDEDRLLGITKNLYPLVARVFGTSTECIIRNLRTVIQIFWMRGNRTYFAALAGFAPEEKPTPGEFIDAIAGYVRYQAARTAEIAAAAAADEAAAAAEEEDAGEELERASGDAG